MRQSLPMAGNIWHNDSNMSDHKIIEREGFAKGSLIMTEGEDAYGAYLLQSGRARVFSESNGKKVEFSILNPGDIFGETALIKDGVRSASVEAIEDCTVILIRREDFKNRLKKSDKAIQAIVKMLTERVLASNSEIVKSKGVNIDNFIALLNQIFKDLLEAMPAEDKGEFKKDAFPVLAQMIDVIEKYRDKL